MPRHPRTTRPGATGAAGADRPGRRRRGRPPKFGRPSRLIFLTLPEDVLERLARVHPDPGWAIVELVEARTAAAARRTREPARPPVELACLPGRRALILVRPEVCRGLRGVSAVPLTDGRAFLMFDRDASLAELELAILDRLDHLPPQAAERRALLAVRQTLRRWRRSGRFAFRAKSLILVEGPLRGTPQRLPPLAATPPARSSPSR